MPYQQQNRVVIKRNRPLLLVGIVSAYLVLNGMRSIIRWFWNFAGITLWDVSSAIIFVLWLLCVIFLGACALWNGSQRLVLDEMGIWYGRIFLRHRMKWEQIRDWGIICDRRTFWEGKKMYLYFSTERLPLSENQEKKLSRQTVRVFLLKRDWEQMQDAVWSYCNERLKIAPFDGLTELTVDDDS